MSSRLLIKGGVVVSLDPDVGTLRSGDVLIEDGRIAAVAPVVDAEAELIDASGQVVMPGLVDAHRHLWYATLRGMAMDATLGELRNEIWPRLAAHYSPEDVYIATRAGIADALANGITTVLDWCHIVNTPEHADEAIRAHQELPIRSVFAYGSSMTRKLRELERPDEAGALGELMRVAEAARRSSGRTSFALALQGPESTSMELTVAEVAAARELGLPMSMHAGIDQGAPRRSVARLAAAGLLGADMQFVHCCTTSRREFGLLAETDARVVICPMAEMVLGIGAPPIERARQAGLRAGLGVDAVCSASGDLFDEARLALAGARLLSRARSPVHRGAPARLQHGTASAADALLSVTLDAAHACWLDDVGSLGVGKRGDVITLRALDPSFESVPDIPSALVACAHGSSVDTVIVEGEVVKRGGTLVGIDRHRIGAELAGSRDRLFAEGGYVLG